MNARARLTIVDALMITASMAVLAMAAPLFLQLMEDNSANLGAGELYLLQMVVPGLVATMMIVVMSIAVGRSPS